MAARNRQNTRLLKTDKITETGKTTQSSKLAKPIKSSSRGRDASKAGPDPRPARGPSRSVTKARLDSAGRLLVPAPLRRALEVEARDAVTLVLKHGVLEVRSLDDADVHRERGTARRPWVGAAVALVCAASAGAASGEDVDFRAYRAHETIRFERQCADETAHRVQAYAKFESEDGRARALVLSVVARGREMYSVELYAAVRLAVVDEGLSQHEAARRFGIDRWTVKKMLSYSPPPGYRRTAPVRRLHNREGRCPCTAAVDARGLRAVASPAGPCPGRLRRGAWALTPIPLQNYPTHAPSPADQQAMPY